MVTQTKLQLAQIEYIEPNPYQVRQIDISNLGNLINSIKKYGFVGHLEVRPNPHTDGGRQQLVYGHRRLRAAELAGMTKVPIVVTERTDAEMRDFAYIENGTVEPLTYWDEGLHFKQLQDSGMSMNQIAETIGKSKGYVQARLDVLRTDEGPMQEAAKSGQLEITVFTTLLTMPADRRMHLFEAVKAGKYTTADLRAIRASLNQPLSSVIAPEDLKFVGPSEPEELDKDPDVPGPDPLVLVPRVFTIPAPKPKALHDSTTFKKLTGRDWAQRALEQMRGLVPILNENCTKADWSTLSDKEIDELMRLKMMVMDLLAVDIPVPA